VSDFNVRKIVRRLQLDRETDNGFLETIPWLCTQCSRCRTFCNDGLDLPDLVMALRRVALEKDLAPEAAGELWAAVKETGSPYKSMTRTKSSWIDDSVEVTSDAETLCWLGCTPSIMSQNIARATAAVMGELSGGFKILEDEPCCGEPLVALGLMDEAKETGEKAVEAIRSSGVRRIVTSCAGCYHTLKHTYPTKLGIEFPDLEVLHLSQYVGEMEDKKLELEDPLRVTYHDPCSLGRHSGVYDAPREILSSIEGLELLEMDPTREETECCGGGGGLWSVDRKMAMEMASRKLARGLAGLDVDAIVTTCPMCYNNFRYTLKKMKSPVQVYELSEIIAMALGRGSN
jgi:Fe-S oxidoreductase